jgi:cyclopropane-fatty-acyl-phospholipid synthase
MAASGLASSLLRRIVIGHLKRLRHGGLTLVDGGQRLHFGERGHALQAEIRVQDANLWGLVASNGSIGAGEAYVLGYWTSHDVTAVVRLFVANLEVLDGIERGLALFGQPVVRALHWFNRNTRSGSRRNIAAHYDLGNDLFERMLDRTMMYSAAMFESVEDSLEQAQLNKLERICRKLELGPEDHLLEIGTGWAAWRSTPRCITAAGSPPPRCRASSTPTPSGASRSRACRIASPSCSRTIATSKASSTSWCPSR